MKLIAHSRQYFCNMLIHKGKILEKIVREREPVITTLAKKMKYTARTIYNHFNATEIEDHILLKYAKVLNYSFREEFPQLYPSFTVSEPPLEYVAVKNSELLLQDVERYRNLYIQALEQKQAITLELADCRKQLAQNVSQKN